MVASKTASCFQLGVRFPDGTLQTTAAVGGGGITSVGLVGTANQITVTGSSPITTSGSWTLSFPSTVDITNLAVSGTTSFTAGSIAIAALASDTISLVDSTGLFTVTHSPATLGGTLTLSTFASQSQNYVLAGPGSGGSGAAAFRALVSGDIPNNAASTTGSSGSCTGNAATATVASGLTGTPSISITNLTVGGTTSFVAGSIATAAIAAGFLPIAGGTMTGILNMTSGIALDWNSDTGLSRLGAASLALGSGAQGDFSGSLKLGNLTQATAVGSAIANSPTLTISGVYEATAGPTYAADSWTIQDVLQASTVNGTSTLMIAHSGTTGAAGVSVPVGSSSGAGLLFGTNTTGFFATATAVNVQLSSGNNSSFNLYEGTTAIAGFQGGSSVLKFTSFSNYYIVIGNNTAENSYTSAPYAVLLGDNGAGITNTSVNISNVGTGADFRPSSGYANFTDLKLNPTINNTSVGPTITSAVITSAISAAVTIGSTAGYVTGASVTIANVSTSGFTGLNGTWVVASATATVLTMTTVGLTAKAQAACNGNVLFGAWNPSLGTYTGLNVSVVETAVIAGVNNSLIDCYAGSAGTTPEFRVSNKGVPTVVGGNATVKAGVPSILAAPTKLTGQQAAQSAVSIVASAAAGMWRISYVAYITQVDTESSVLGGVTGFAVNFTDPDDSVAKTSNPTTPTISSANTTGTTISGALYVYAKAATAITYNFGYTTTGSGATAMSYSIAVYAEYLG